MYSFVSHKVRVLKTKVLVNELNKRLNDFAAKKPRKAYQALDEIEKIRALIAKIEKESNITGALTDVQKILDDQEQSILEQVRKKTS